MKKVLSIIFCILSFIISFRAINNNNVSAATNGQTINNYCCDPMGDAVCLSNAKSTLDAKRIV